MEYSGIGDFIGKLLSAIVSRPRVNLSALTVDVMTPI